MSCMQAESRLIQVVYIILLYIRLQLVIDTQENPLQKDHEAQSITS